MRERHRTAREYIINNKCLLLILAIITLFFVNTKSQPECYSTMPNVWHQTASKYIKSNEGLRLKPYRCSVGKLHIGYGRNLDDKGISKNEAELMLENDIEDCLKSLCGVFDYSVFEHLSGNRQIVLLDLMLNLGNTRFCKFEKMIQAVKDEDFEEAARQILDSVYATQLPNRSKRNADMMREG